MRTALAVALTLSVGLSADVFGQPRPSEGQAAIAKLREEMKVPGVRLQALDESDRKLAISDQAQIDTTDLLKRSERRILEEDRPRWKVRWDAFQLSKQQHIASGCPWDGGQLPEADADRCNRAIIPLNTELAALVKEEARLNGLLADIATTRQAVTDTTLANWRQRKTNYALRDDLEALKASQEAELRKLYVAAIIEAVGQAKLRDKASRACEAITKIEESVCCHRVVWDQVPPAQCDVPLIYGVFERAGIFQSTIIR